ncbi:MAG: tail protein X [Chitinophagaceae bacterium]|nr:tail protein X [Chitinophagaceae bacterium]
MADTIQYITQEGERWDAISQKMYGTLSEVPRILDTNPQIPITDRLKGGLVLEIPILESNDVTVNSNLLPPWKRHNS